MFVAHSMILCETIQTKWYFVGRDGWIEEKFSVSRVGRQLLV